MDEQERQRRYFQLLDLPLPGASEAHKAALIRAHELRKFEIENYWKRSSYFWGFQLVSFGALALSAREGQFILPAVLVVSVLGALAALAGILTARGSKFWQQNWEAHVDFLEKAFEGNLHTTVLVRTEIQYSVSRVNERFMEVLFAAWILVFGICAALIAFPSLLTLPLCTTRIMQIGIPGAVLFLGALNLTWGQKSDLRERAYRHDNLERVFPDSSDNS